MSDTFKVMKLSFGATANALDGEAGEIIGAVMEVGSHKITHAVVLLGGGPAGVQVLVPVGLFTDTTTESAEISVTREALLQTMTKAGSAPYISASARATKKGAVIGNVVHISFAADTGAANNIVIKSGNALMVAPSSGIVSISDNAKTIEFADTDALFIPYLPDTDLQDTIYNALYNYPRLRIDLHSVQIRAIDGEVWLTGFVSSTLNRKIIEKLLTPIQGISELHNDIVDDTDLSITIARALSQDSRTRGKMIGVYSNLGNVLLRGYAQDESIAQVALQIAGGVSGSAKVVNQMVVGEQTYIPMLAPVTNHEDITPGE